MSVKGIRVVRGPDWNYGKTDGGDGHVGTVTKDNEDDTAEVVFIGFIIGHQAKKNLPSSKLKGSSSDKELT